MEPLWEGFRWFTLAVAVWLTARGFLPRPANEEERSRNQTTGFLGLFFLLSHTLVLRAVEAYWPAELILIAASLWTFYRALRPPQPTGPTTTATTP